MINLRYHVFSLVAVFAALAIGIVVGSSTVRSGLVDNLRGNVQRAEDRISEIESENDVLSRRAEQIDLLAVDGVQLVDGAAEGVPVLWVTAPGLDDEAWRGVQRMARAAGAISVGRVVVEADVFVDGDVGDLAAALGSSSADADELRSELGRVLALRIDRALDLMEVPRPPGGPDDTASPVAVPSRTVAPDTVVPDTVVPDTVVPGTVVPGTAPISTGAPTTSVPDTTTTTLPIGPNSGVALTAALGDLEDAGVIDLDDFDASGIPEGVVVQVVVLDDLRSGIDAGQVLVPLLDDLTGSIDRLVVMAEARTSPSPENAPPSVVQLVRDNGRLSDEMSTVDNLDDPPGWMATVLALRNHLAGESGHYGYRSGSEHLLPQPVQ